MSEIDTYIVLLRAVNVGGKNIIKMQELKSELLKTGFEKVITYIQSGNIIIQTSQFSKESIKNKVKDIILQHFNLDITVIIESVADLQKIIHHNPYSTIPEANFSHIFITIFEDIPTLTLLEKIKEVKFDGEYFELKEQILYFYLPEGQGKSKLSNSFFENKLKTKGTARNLNTMHKLIDLASTI